MKRARALFASLACAAVAACAGARHEPASAPPAAEEPSGDERLRAPSSLEGAPTEVASLEEAEALFAQALVALGGPPAPAGRPEPAVGGGAGGPPPGSPAASAPPEKRESPKRAAAGAEAPPSAGDTEEKSSAPDCKAACQAFASLERAVEAICRLAGDPSERCERARRVRQEKSAQVAACECARRP